MMGYMMLIQQILDEQIIINLLQDFLIHMEEEKY